MQEGETLFVWSRRAYLAMERAYDLALISCGIRSLDFEILVTVQRCAGVSISSLARSTGWERSALSKHLRQLEAAAVVVIDRRKGRSRMTLTPMGLALIESARKTCAQLEEEWAQDLGGAAEGIVTVMQRVAALRRRSPAVRSGAPLEGM